MRKWIIGVGVFLVLLVGILLAVVLINLNSYLNRNRDWLARQAEVSLGRAVRFDAVGVSILGGFGASVDNLHVADDPRFGKDDFMRARRVIVAVKLLPVLRGRFEVSHVVLQQPALKVVRTREGYNFASLGKPSSRAREREPGSAEKEAVASPPEGRAIPLLVSTIEITGAEIRFRDETAKPVTDVTIRNLDFSATDVGLTTPVRLELAAAVLGETRNVHASGTFGPLGAKPELAEIPVDVELEVGPVILDDLKKAYPSLRKIPLETQDPVSLKATARGSVEDLKLEAALDATEARVAYSTTFRKPARVPLRLELNGRRTAEAIDIARFVLTLADLQLEATGKIVTQPALALDVQLETRRASVAGLERLFPALEDFTLSGSLETRLHVDGRLERKRLPALNGTVTLTDVAVRKKNLPCDIEQLSAKIELKGNRAALLPSKFKVAGEEVELRATVENLAVPKVSFATRSPALNLAALGAGGTGTRKPEVLRGLDVKGNLQTEPALQASGMVRSSDGTVQDIEYQALEADWRLEAGPNIRLEKLNLATFGGTCAGEGSYDASKSTPVFDFRSKVRDMRLRDLLASQFPRAAGRIEGDIDADLVLQGSGRTWEIIRNTLRGNGRTEVKNGLLKDINLAEGVLSGLTGIEQLSGLLPDRVRKKYPQVFGTGDTVFEALRGSVNVADGRVSTDDLTLAARDYTILGQGFFRFDSDVDFTATLLASRKLTEDLTADFREAKYLVGNEGRLLIPFVLRGTLPDARPKPDSKHVLRALQGALVDKGIDKLLGKKRQEQEPAMPDADKQPPTEKELLRRGLEGLLGR